MNSKYTGALDKNLFKRVVVMILGGGRGTRLYPLTQYRSKPAVPIGGKYRLIDIPLSNCINSGLEKIYVLTQFNSVSLHHHVHSYTFDSFNRGFVEILAAQQRNDQETWYQGTADAVRKNLNYIEHRDIDYVLILSGDQLYRMDFEPMLKTHLDSNADVTIASVPVTRDQAKSLGIMRLEDPGRVVGFLEKPKTDEELNHVRTDPEWIDRTGIPSHGRDFMASMGIYLFNRKILVDALTQTDYADFGKEIFPAVFRSKHVQVHLFDGYWEDVGTIRSFFEANINMASERPEFSLDCPDWPIFTENRFLPPSRIRSANIKDSIISDGSLIEEGAVVENCIIGVRCKIGKNARLKNVIVMGNDFYPGNAEKPQTDVPPMGIGDNSIIEETIIDKNCQIGKNVAIINRDKIQLTPELPFGMIRDGVVCISKHAIIPDNWSLERAVS
ncbi:MAG: glucose-1-phosphate adenylyltransferase [Planctomycetaceae bacterium]|jgi:glucose-1-phosphate adenylyltransferase|nr:glucose-1-phosphate adenylyltransferase [Planctomycetaceae bacterium]